jgi:uncharacterized damage-inducible protein DinB
MTLAEQWIESWQINQRIHVYMLEAIPEAALQGKATSGGRSVAEQFAHIHNVRLMWLQEAAPDLLDGVSKFASKTAAEKAALTKEALAQGLEASAQAITILLQRGLESGRIKGFKPHPAAFLGYLLSHEGYHRGEIGLILTQSGTPLDQKTSFGLWEWGVR